MVLKTQLPVILLDLDQKWPSTTQLSLEFLLDLRLKYGEIAAIVNGFYPFTNVEKFSILAIYKVLGYTSLRNGDARGRLVKSHERVTRVYKIPLFPFLFNKMFHNFLYFYMQQLFRTQQINIWSYFKYFTQGYTINNLLAIFLVLCKHLQKSWIKLICIMF